MSQLSKDIKRTLLIKGVLLFLLWYSCVHNVPHHKPKVEQTINHMIN